PEMAKVSLGMGKFRYRILTCEVENMIAAPRQNVPRNVLPSQDGQANLRLKPFLVANRVTYDKSIVVVGRNASLNFSVNQFGQRPTDILRFQHNLRCVKSLGDEREVVRLKVKSLRKLAERSWIF